MIEGDPADSFFLIRDGFVALEMQAPAGTITIETLHSGDPWLVLAIRAVPLAFRCPLAGDDPGDKFDAAALRRRSAEDAQLGYQLMRSFTSVIVERLHATRLQLLDVYGSVSVS